MPVSTQQIVKGARREFELTQSLGKFMYTSVAKWGSLKAQVCTKTGKSITFAQLKKNSVTAAIELNKLGVKQNDVISICSTNNIDVTSALLGSLYIGAVVAPLDPVLNEIDTKHLLSISRPRIIFCEPPTETMFENLIAEMSLNATIVVFGSTTRNISFNTLLTSDVNLNELEIVDFSDPENHLAFIEPSSGTTGLPKCVMITHANMLVQLQVLQDKPAVGLPVLNMSSLYWISGLLLTLACTAFGSIKVITPPFDAEYTLQMIEKYGVIALIVGVTYYHSIVTHPNATKYDLSSLIILSVGGGQITDNQLNKGLKVFPNAEFSNGYGLTEVAGPAFLLNQGQLKCLGRLMYNVEGKIIDPDNGRSLGPNQVGELCLRGPIVCKGYYNDQGSTEKAFDANNWFKTGDSCYYTEDNIFFFEGRMKEQFKCRGWQISPLEVEIVLMSHPLIKEAAVIGVPHEVDVARARAFISCIPGAQLSEAEVHTYMAANLSQTKQLRGGVIFLERLPVTSSGKIKKKDLLQIESSIKM